MNIKFTFLSLILLTFAVNEIQAQNRTPYGDFPNVSVSATAGTQGIGADVKVNLSQPFGVRAGVSILPFNWQTVYTGRSEPTNLKLDADFANAHLMFDWHPSTDHDNILDKFILTVGGAYWWKDKGTAVITYNGIYKYGDIEIPSDQLGELQGKVQWNKVTPYIGVGLDDIFSARTFDFGFSIGTYYMGKPDASLTGTKLLAANTSNSEQFAKNLSYYRFLPVVQLNFNIHL
ncbi:hypothetical protein [Pedobacter hartonius]|uniref:Outer membrane protein beta-barrel domain-containing protein n=1 Tax=Pedobacter hartonius TaxID=425514 RepID=A0A1H4D1M5_9SPHI|nr:hypothetical protein [Pedobacter hartonius]SEA66491.1 hypothetical protein SAMN05443550_104286 [Pedobacter hartonius]